MSREGVPGGRVWRSEPDRGKSVRKGSRGDVAAELGGLVGGSAGQGVGGPKQEGAW